MTAAEANRPDTRDAVRAACKRRGRTVSDHLVRDWLNGWPVKDVLDELLCSVADELGIDTTTCPQRSPEAVAVWKAQRRGKAACPECARLRDRIAELENSHQTPAKSHQEMGRANISDLDTVLPTRSRPRIVKIEMPDGETAVG